MAVTVSWSHMAMGKASPGNVLKVVWIQDVLLLDACYKGLEHIVSRFGIWVLKAAHCRPSTNVHDAAAAARIPDIRCKSESRDLRNHMSQVAEALPATSNLVVVIQSTSLSALGWRRL